MYDKFYIGMSITGLEDNGTERPISRVTLMADDNNAITAGDDTGRELLANCPHATQAMVNAILNQVRGYRYQMFSAEEARLDPSAELGDGVTAGGIYAVISRLNESGSGYAGIIAPGKSELEDEYPSVGPTTREFDRKIAETRSSITKTAEEIRLEVSATDGRVSSLTMRVDSIVSQVQGLEGNYSKLEQYVDSITLEVSNGSTSSTISLKAGNATINSETITMNGLVTYTGLSGGTTTIDGSCIKTGTISASRLDLTNYSTTRQVESMISSEVDGLSLSVSNGTSSSTIRLYSGGVLIDSGTVTFSGMVTFNDLSGNAGTIINGGAIDTDTLRVDSLYGRIVNLRTNSGSLAGSISITGASTANYAIELASEGALRLSAGYGQVFIENGSSTYIQIETSKITVGDPLDAISFVPRWNGSGNLGTANQKWGNIYASSGTINTSDRNEKYDIVYGLEQYDKLFDMLKPIHFKFKDGTSGRTHHGLCAQDVEQALIDCNIDSVDFAGFIKFQREEDGEAVDSEYGYGLRYSEFIPMLIEQTQILKRKVKRLEEILWN